MSSKRPDPLAYENKAFVESDEARPLRIMISDSRYGNTYTGGREAFTQGSYDLAELYRGVLAEGLTPCPLSS